VFGASADNLEQQNIFEIPAYPGTEILSSHQKNLDDSSITILRILKTSDGSSFKKESVIDFYKTHFKARGWNVGYLCAKGLTPYTLLEILFNKDNEYANIRTRGKFYFWVAPKDGMIIISMELHVSPYIRGYSKNLYDIIENNIKNEANRIKYIVEERKGEHFRDWFDYNKNEYLVIARSFELNKDEDNECNHERQGVIEIKVLIYFNQEIAVKLEKIYASRRNRIKPNFYYRKRTVLRNGNMIILIDNRDYTQIDKVKDLAEFLSF
jgi:hypothetical protein